MAPSTAIAAAPAAEKEGILSRFGIDTAAIAEKVTEFFKPQKLEPLFQEHKSGVVVATVWLAIYLRSWLTYLIPFPSLGLTLSLVAFLVLLLPLLPTSHGSSGNILGGLPRHGYTTLTTSLAKLYNRTLPPWLLTHVIPALLLLPLARAIPLLLLLTVSGIARSYRAGTAEVAAAADAAVRRAETAGQRAAEHARAATALEMAALQLASNVDPEDYSERPRLDAAKEAREEAEGVAQEVAGVVARRLDKVIQAAEGAKNAVREDGDLKFAREAVANLDGLVVSLVQAEEAIGGRLQAARDYLWAASLGQA